MTDKTPTDNTELRTELWEIIVKTLRGHGEWGDEHLELLQALVIFCRRYLATKTKEAEIEVRVKENERWIRYYERMREINRPSTSTLLQDYQGVLIKWHKSTIKQLKALKPPTGEK